MSHVASQPTPDPSGRLCGPDVVVYSPRVQAGFGPKMWREMTSHLLGSRGLTWRFFLRNYSARYRQSILGFIWAVVPTVITVAMFAYLNRTRILAIGETTLPYPLFVLVGMTVWQVFAAGLTRMTTSLAQAGSLIVKINFARETLVLAAFMESLIDLAIRVLLVVGLFAYYGIMPPASACVIPMVLIPLCVFTMACGFLLSLANAVFRDIGNSLTFFLTFLMFLAPVVYPPPTEWPSNLVNYLNPVSPFIIAVRDLASDGAIHNAGPLAIVSGLSLVLFVLAWRTFNLTIARIAERV